METPTCSKSAPSTPITVNAYRRKRPFDRERHDTYEHRVFSLIEELANYPELLHYVANKLRTLGDIYNVRRVFRAATSLTNPYFRRAIFNRNTISANNKIALQTYNVDEVGSMCSVCKATLPPSKDFSIVVNCTFPLCMQPAMMRPVPPLLSLHTSGTTAAFARQVVLTNRNSACVQMTNSKMLFRYRQYGFGDEPPQDWTISSRAFAAAWARHIVFPVALTPWKLVQFSVSVRVGRCTCEHEENGTPIDARECYQNHLDGNECHATWSPWSKPSLPLFPPSKYEAGFINRRAAFINRLRADATVEDEDDSQSMEF